MRRYESRTKTCLFFSLFSCERDLLKTVEETFLRCFHNKGVFRSGCKIFGSRVTLSFVFGN
jgi:hypothetical protein